MGPEGSLLFSPLSEEYLNPSQFEPGLERVSLPWLFATGRIERCCVWTKPRPPPRPMLIPRPSRIRRTEGENGNVFANRGTDVVDRRGIPSKREITGAEIACLI